MSHPWSNPILKGLFVLNMLLAVKGADAQQDYNTVKTDPTDAFKAAAHIKTADTGTASKNQRVAVFGHDLSKINDKDYLAEVDESGAKVTSRAFGYIIESQKEDGSVKKDSAMFYKSESDVNGYHVQRRTILAHPHEAQGYPGFFGDEKTYEDYTVTSPDGKTVTIVCNLKNGIYLTNVTNSDGKKYLTTIPIDVMNNQVQNDLMTKPEMAFTFANEISTDKKGRPSNRNVSPFNTLQPGYPGQDLSNGTFQIINIDGSGFGRLEMHHSYSAPDKPGFVTLKQ